MKNAVFSKNFKVFLLSLMLPLTSCTLLTPSSSGDISSSSNPSSSSMTTSSIPSSEAGSSTSGTSSQTSSTPSSETSHETSSELPSSWEIPSEGEYIEGMALTWPNQVIQQVFTSPARYSIPAFISPMPFYYQYILAPTPLVMVMTQIGQIDGETQYKNQLTAAQWTIHEEYKLMMEFTVAVDPTKELMVMFLASEGDMVFEISNFDQAFFDELDVQTSASWPGMAIADYLGTKVTSTVPPFVSNYEYYYLLPSDMVEFFVVFTRVDQASELNAYLSTLAQMGWSLVTGTEIEMYVDENRQIYLSLEYQEGYVSIFIIPVGEEPVDPEVITTTSWPQEAMDAFLIHSFVQIDIPPFTASEYHHVVTQEETGPALHIFSSSASTTMEDYVQTAITAGWNVNPMHENAGTGYYAIDPEFEVFFIIENDFDLFSLTIWTYHVSLESYFGDGMLPFETSEEWPLQAVMDIISEEPTSPIPVFESTLYQYRQESDDFGSYLMIMANGNASGPAAYQSVLQGAGYTVKATDNYGTLTYVVYDADHRVFLYYYYAEGHVTIIVRDYDETMIGGDPDYPMPDTMFWPVDVLGNEFGASLSGLIPVLNAQNGYLVDFDSLDGISYVGLTALGVTEEPYSYYRSMLENQSWTVSYASGLEQTDYLPYIAFDTSKSVMMVMSLVEVGVQLIILSYDQEYIDAVVWETSPMLTSWPSEFIANRYGNAFMNAIPAYTQSSAYQPMIYRDEGQSIDWILVNIFVNDAGNDVDTYIANLITQGWTIVTNHDSVSGFYSYLAYNIDKTVLMEFYFMAANDQFITMWLLPFNQSVYDFEKTHYFTEEENPPTNAWPTAEIQAMFPDIGFVIPAFPLDEQQALSYEVDQPNRAITVTITETTSQAMTLYMSVLENEEFMVYLNYDENYAVAMNPSGLVSVYYYYSEGTLTIEIKPYSMYEFAEYYANQVQNVAMAFPSHIIEQVFGLGAAQMIPAYENVNPFVYLTRWFMFKPTLQIQLNSSEEEFSNYYFALMDKGWYMNGIIAQGAYTAIDPTGSFKIEASINQDGVVSIDLTLVPQQAS